VPSFGVICLLLSRKKQFHEGERRLLAAKKEAGEISLASIIRDAIFFW
jgi:hypothetical protein